MLKKFGRVVVGISAFTMLALLPFVYINNYGKKAAMNNFFRTYDPFKHGEDFRKRQIGGKFYEDGRLQVNDLQEIK